MGSSALVDILCIAETGKLCLYSSRAISLYPLGAGKTLTYCIPLVEFVKTRPDIKKMPLRREKAEPLALILTPTHELAIEVHEMSKFGFSAMTFAHVGYITKFLWGQRHPPGDSEVE